MTDKTQALLPVTSDEYLIRKGGAYYRPNAAGYTNNVDEAGRYSLEDAIRHSHPNGPDGPRDGIDYMPAPPVRRREATLQADVELVAEAVAQRCSVGSNKDGSPKAPVRYSTIWQAARLGALEYAKMTRQDHFVDVTGMIATEHRIDMANVGEALMEALRDASGHEFMKTWAPADCPTEIVFDLLNALDEARAALTPSAPEPVQKLHELPEGHRWCRHCEQKDPHCSVCEGVGYLPSALSGDAGEGE